MPVKAKNLNLGILAHVDAGKTTLAEAILYNTGTIRKAGRVDRGDAFLDTDAMEKQRGITIFSKQARLNLDGMWITLLDTPGHVDFSAEMERSLMVMDAAVLLISGADGVQGHTLTLWNLLAKYNVPTVLFINKMDQPGTDADEILAQLREKLNENCVAFPGNAPDLITEDGNEAAMDEADAFFEELAMCDEDLMESYLDGQPVRREDVQELILERKLFPCCFGSALKNTGVEEFLRQLSSFLTMPEYPDEFGARVFKITRDHAGARLTHMKVTGGSLKVKQVLSGTSADGERPWEEKADQIRLYSGESFEAVQEAPAGTVCAVTGLTSTFAGEGLGAETENAEPILEPVLTYSLLFPEGQDVHEMYLKLRVLEEEIPELHLVWEERAREIRAQVMGEIQIEILQRMMRERYGVNAEFGQGRIVYRETIRGVAYGVGHYEPLRHYAEVHVLIEEGEPGTGVQVSSACSTDNLDLNWQRLAMTHLLERKHVGVLTGSELTDVRITVVGGKAHLKHTEGGDFRQATYRAVRNALMKSEIVLLEPIYKFRLELPTSNVGRAMTDIQKMHGTCSAPEMLPDGQRSALTGTAPVSEMRDYQREMTAYTGGNGRLTLQLKGYEPCHNTEEVYNRIGYDPEADIANPTGSVFCAHGAGYYVTWDQVEEFMHVEKQVYMPGDRKAPTQEEVIRNARRAAGERGADIQDDAELMAIFERTFGSIKQDRGSWKRSGGIHRYDPKEVTRRYGKASVPKEKYLLVDGYNIIYAWEDLNELAKIDMGAARGKLLDILSNYQGYRKMNLIVVFDAYKVENGQEHIERFHNIHVVFTKEAETADAYIEKTVHQIGSKGEVSVATSDGAEQVIIFGAGATRVSARDLRKDIKETCREIQSVYLQENPGGKIYLFNDLSSDLAEFLNEVRLGRKDFSDYPDQGK